jgi:transcriptional antiterminator RfaH
VLKTNNWICLYTQPHRENVAKASLVGAGHEVFAPMSIRLVLRHKKYIQTLRPLFPRYIFSRSDSDMVGTNRMRGVTSYAGYSLENSMVDDIIIRAIKDRCDEHGIVSINHNEIQAGQAVTVLQGPFAGLQAIFSEPDDRKRSYILLDLLGKTNRIRVPNSSIQVAA